jgi:two-component system, NtrC family, nitrogen regulation sensor histidine kinase NtrY
LINHIRQSAYKHGYLLITAAWLYTISFIFINYWSYNASPQKVKSKLEQRIASAESRFQQISQDSNLLEQLLADTLTKAKSQLMDQPLGLFVYKNNNGQEPNMVYWNNNAMYVNAYDLKKPDGAYYQKLQNGEFELLVKRVQLGKQSLVLIGMVPIRWDYFIENKYLQTRFDGFKELSKQYEVSIAPTAIPILNASGVELFRIQLIAGKSFIAYDAITLALRTLAIILLFLFMHAIAEDLVKLRGFWNGFLLLFSSVFLLRILSYQVSFPFDFDKIPLFDPSIYASNLFHRSLGDLLVNSILFFWLIRFYQDHHPSSFSAPTFLPDYISKDFRVFLLTISALSIGNIIKSLVQDSKISFDTNNLGIYTMVAFIILCLLVLFFYYLSQVLLAPLMKAGVGIYRQMLVAAGSGLMFFFIFVKPQDTLINMLILLWLLGYLLLIHIRKSDLKVSLIRSDFFIFWVMIFALSVAAIVLFENKQVERTQRQRMAERLAQQTDPSGENLLNIAATNFDEVFLSSNFHRLESEYSNKFIKDSLINENFSGYLNKFDTRIYTYDAATQPLHNEDSTSYASIKTILLNQAKPTVIPGLYSYEKIADGFSFIYQKEIKEAGLIKGYLFVIIKSKRYKSEALYPELFNQSQDISSDLNTNYSYAVYNKGKLINHFNNYSFPSQLNEKKFPGFEFTYQQNGVYNELWYNSGNGKLVLVVKRNTWVLESLTLFAYLFVSFLVIIFLFQSGSYLFTHRFQWSKFKEAFQWNIRSQIQATIIFLSVFSFIVIGIVTISFFIIRFNRNNEDRLSKSIQVMANEIDNRLRAQLEFDDVLTMSNMSEMEDLEKKISDISDLHNVDINYYDTKGNLKISTQPYIYNKHLLSEKMHPEAYLQLHANKSIRYLQSEKVGEFNYLSIYVPLVDESGNNYAYLNIPYLNSQSELTQEISGFLATLINLNAFIFLVAGAIAFFLTNRIIQSFSLIGEKMQQVNLGKVNEVIEWNRKDEIGILVAEYNKMVHKLESSAEALAQSEREGAWREMARQVAHEIKNPLTPMKLSIQYLQKAIEAGSPNVKELSQKMAVTLIEQIDQLSKIAGDFSQFANIGNARLEIFDINESVNSVIQLYQTYPNLQIKGQLVQEPLLIQSDKLQMNRLLTNLIKNAVEAGEGSNSKLVVNVSVQKESTTLLLTIEDHSGGIPESLAQHLFKPNFTTKTSGTGLGLAICKGIVEKAKGNIWFETKEGHGTTFYIRLPLVHS